MIQSPFVLHPFPGRSRYTARDHALWKALYTRQRHALAAQGANHFLRQLRRLEARMDWHQIPSFEGVEKALKRATGWSISSLHLDDAPRAFFAQLASRVLPIPLQMRKSAHLDYTLQPDLFQGLFGQVPLLMDAEYADALVVFGQIGLQIADDDATSSALFRLYQRITQFGVLAGNGLAGQFTSEAVGSALLSNYVVTRGLATGFHAEQVDGFCDCLAHDACHVHAAGSFLEIGSWEQVAADLKVWVKAHKSSSPLHRAAE